MRQNITYDMPFPEGVVAVVDKPLTWTSSDVVRKLKYLLRKLGYPKIKIGHAGTLDPLATGVLLVCIGKATKRVDELQAGEKEYVADVVLGATTPSGDLEHPPSPQNISPPNSSVAHSTHSPANASRPLPSTRPR